MTELTLDWQLSSPVRQRAQLSPPPVSSFGSASEVEEIRLEGDKTMKLQDPITSAQTMSRSILRLNVAEESRNKWAIFGRNS